MNGDRGDGVCPDSIGHSNLELVGARGGVLLDDEEAGSLVQDEVTGRRKQHTQLEAFILIHRTSSHRGGGVYPH